MTLIALHQFLILYLWFGSLAIVLFWGLLTRSYERFSQRRMYSIGYSVPALVFGVVGVRVASNPFGHPGLGDALLVVIGAVVMIGMTSYAAYYMLRRN